MNHIEKIEAYLNKTLSSQERIAFEKDCQTDEVLAKELAFYLEAKQAAKEAKQTTFHERYYTNKVRDKRLKLVLGVIGVLIILLGIWIFSQKEEVPQTFAALAEQQEPIDFLISGTTLSGTASTQEMVETAIQSVKSEDFKTALQMLDTISANDENYYKVLEVSGWCNFKLENYQAAIADFEAYLQQENGGNRAAIRWNKALAHLELEESEEAKALLEVLVDLNAMNEEAAAVLLKQMERMKL